MTFNLDDGLQYTGFVKFFSSPTLVQGYFSSRFKRDLTDQECIDYIKRKKETLYTAVQNFLYDTSEIEVTFVDEDAYNWWNKLDQIRCRPETEYDPYSQKQKKTNKYLLEVPLPPNKIFETE